MKTTGIKPEILTAPRLNVDGLSRDIGRLLVLAPHPDDESLSCGGLIALLRDCGTDVQIVFVTSGTASHPNSTQYLPEELGQIREKEAIRACSRLGVSKKKISFLRENDSQLSQLSNKRRNELSCGIIQKFNKGKFSSLALPWRRDPHADHKVVHNLGKRALKFLVPEITVIEYPVWLWKNGKEADWPLPGEILPYRLNIASVIDRKRRAIQEHKSQLGQVVDDDPDGFVLTENLLQPFTSETEYFFLTNPRKPRTLDSGYFEKLYQKNRDPWNFKKSEYEQGKYKLSVSMLGNSKFKKALEIGCSIGMHTKELAMNCDNLLAVDVSQLAVQEAKWICKHIHNIQFKTCDVTKNFPKDKFDLITLCEVGYYFEEETLLTLFRNIEEGLLNNGKFLMVHWTPYVPNYPLTGNQVHELFETFVQEHQSFKETVHEIHELFRLQIWLKST